MVRVEEGSSLYLKSYMHKDQYAREKVDQVAL